MKDFWNQRYAAEDYAYGTEPNLFFQQQLDQLDPGQLLLPAEGEGRNAVYAARRGWQVDAYDISAAGQIKAQKLATRHKVSIHYQVGTLAQLDFTTASFDAIGLIYAHLPPDLRRITHQQLAALLRPGGYIILEAFSQKHLNYNRQNPKAGGPKSLEMLYTTDLLKEDFQGFEFLQLEETETKLKEGLYHIGKSAVVRMLAQKK